MFSGIVSTIGRVTEILPREAGISLHVNAPELDFPDIAVGDSIAHNGVCLTLTSLQAPEYTVDVSPQTLSTTVGLDQNGAMLNLERALRLADHLDGHLVSGHVDGVGEVVDVQPVGDNRALSIRAPSELARYIAPKGSIAVDGVSLTVNVVSDHDQGSDFDIHLIAHTLAQTNLSRLSRGSRVNLEVDLIARYLDRLNSSGPGADDQTVVS